MSDKLEIFKKKLLYRSAYRGTKEMDILLNSFVKKYIDDLTDNQLKQLEANHYSLSLGEPSKLKDINEHMVWQQQIDLLENTITNLRRHKIKLQNG